MDGARQSGAWAQPDEAAPGLKGSSRNGATIREAPKKPLLRRLSQTSKQLDGSPSERRGGRTERAPELVSNGGPPRRRGGRRDGAPRRQGVQGREHGTDEATGRERTEQRPRRRGQTEPGPSGASLGGRSCGWKAPSENDPSMRRPRDPRPGRRGLGPSRIPLTSLREAPDQTESPRPPSCRSSATPRRHQSFRLLSEGPRSDAASLETTADAVPATDAGPTPRSAPSTAPDAAAKPA